jgi:hypothetical protein
MKNRLNPHDLLPVGTPVMVRNLRGKVTKAEMLPAIPCGFVAVHTVKLEEKLATFGAGRSRWEAIKPKEQTCNYSFISY